MGAGRSLLDMLWEELDRIIDDLMEDDDFFDDDSGWDRTRAQGRAEGVSYSIAVITMAPKTPDINVIKQEAMERWEARQG